MKKRSSKVRKKPAGRRSPSGEPPCTDPAKALNHRERQAKRKQEFVFRALCLKAAVAVVAMATILCLCGLFLAYNRPEFLQQILPVVAYAAGTCRWAHRKCKSGCERCA